MMWPEALVTITLTICATIVIVAMIRTGHRDK